MADVPEGEPAPAEEVPPAIPPVEEPTELEPEPEE